MNAATLRADVIHLGPRYHEQGACSGEVTPVSTNHPDTAAEAIGHMREAALDNARTGT